MRKFEKSDARATAFLLELYTVKELAALFRLHPETIYRMAKRGDIICHTIRGRKRFRRQEIEDFLESCVDVR
jgi:excisionase family DNA binding protein